MDNNNHFIYFRKTLNIKFLPIIAWPIELIKMIFCFCKNFLKKQIDTQKKLKTVAINIKKDDILK